MRFQIRPLRLPRAGDHRLPVGGRGIVINDEYRHTSLLATLRKVWDLGDPFTQRDAAARTFEHLLSRESPRDPATWPDSTPRPVPDWQLTRSNSGRR